MKTRIIFATLLFIGMVSSCKKEQTLAPNDSATVSPSFLFGMDTDTITNDNPPPPNDNGENPFEIGG